MTVIPVPTVPAETPLIEAGSLLLRTERAVVLVVEGTHLAGLLTERALLAAAIGQPMRSMPG